MQVIVLLPIQPRQLPRTALPPVARPGAPSASAGTFYYLPDPPPGLAEAARLRLGLARPPGELLLAAPGPLRHSPKVEEAARKAAVGLLKLVTLELAKQPGLPAGLRTGIPLAWSVYNAHALYRRWQGGADIQTLAIGVGELMLDGWGKATDGSLLPDSMALGPIMAESFGFALLTADTLKDGRDVTMALLDDKLASASPLYQAARCFEPVLQAALSDRPELAGVTLQPLPPALPMAEATPPVM